MTNEAQPLSSCSALQRVIASGARAARSRRRARSLPRAGAGGGARRRRRHLPARRAPQRIAAPRTDRRDQAVDLRSASFSPRLASTSSARIRFRPARCSPARPGFAHGLCAARRRRPAVGFLGSFRGEPALADSTRARSRPSPPSRRSPSRARACTSRPSCARRWRTRSTTAPSGCSIPTPTCPAHPRDRVQGFAHGDGGFLLALLDERRRRAGRARPRRRQGHAAGRHGAPATAPLTWRVAGVSTRRSRRGRRASSIPTASSARSRGTRDARVRALHHAPGRPPLGQLFVSSGEPRIYDEAEIDAMQLLSTMAARRWRARRRSRPQSAPSRARRRHPRAPADRGRRHGHARRDRAHQRRRPRLRAAHGLGEARVARGAGAIAHLRRDGSRCRRRRAAWRAPSPATPRRAS